MFLSSLKYECQLNTIQRHLARVKGYTFFPLSPQERPPAKETRGNKMRTIDPSSRGSRAPSVISTKIITTRSAVECFRPCLEAPPPPLHLLATREISSTFTGGFFPPFFSRRPIKPSEFRRQSDGVILIVRKPYLLRPRARNPTLIIVRLGQITGNDGTRTTRVIYKLHAPPPLSRS